MRIAFNVSNEGCFIDCLKIHSPRITLRFIRATPPDLENFKFFEKII